MLAGGAFVAFLDFGFAWYRGEDFRSYISLGASLFLMTMLPMLHRTQSLELVFGIGGSLACICCLGSFYLSGEFYFLALGISIPIGTTMWVAPKTSLAISLIYGVAAFVLTAAVTQNWYTPPYMNGELFQGALSDSFVALLVLGLIAGTSIYRERVIDTSESKRRAGDASLQKQLSGLRLLAETTSELLKDDPSKERWTQLLGRMARHLDCGLFTNYEVENDKLHLVASGGLPDSVIDNYRILSFGEKVCGTCAMIEEVVYLREPDYSGHPQGDELRALGLRAILVVPLKFGGKLVGTLAFATLTKNSFAEEDIDFMTMLGQAVASVRGRALADAQARVSESRFRTVIDRASHSFFLVGHGGRFVDVNLQACLSLGYEREELLQLQFSDLLVGMEADEVQELENCLGVEDFRFIKVRHRRKDGTDFPVEVCLSRVSLDGGNYVVALAQDASDRQQLADQMIQAKKMEAIGRLAGGVAHDFNNLLCVINSYSEILMADKSLEERQRIWMRAIFDAGQRGADLTRQLLVFGRKAVFDSKEIDLNEVVADAQQLLARLIGENIKLELTLSSGPCRVLADRSQISQVLFNLAENARDAMPRGGTLVLETKFVQATDSNWDEKQSESLAILGSRDCVQLIVSDTGSGIATELIPEVFDPFFTTKDVGEGTGLGLAVAYGIAKESGGSIDVESEPGQGSKFTMTLPSYALPTHEPSQPTHGARIAPPHFKVNALVLLVEDEAEVRSVTSLSLRQQGYVVLEALSSRHAIDLAKQYADELRVLITDVVMPELNGPEMVAQIHKFLPNLPVLYMSGYSYDTLSKITDLGEFNGLLNKPFSLQELYSRVQQTISQDAGKKRHAT